MKTAAIQTEISKEEYICYLYLSIADADMHISDKEIVAVQLGMKRLLSRHCPPLRIDVEEMVHSVQSAIRLQSEDEKKEVILHLSKRYPLSIDMKMDLISDIHELIHADEFIALSEYNMLNFIRLCLINNSVLPSPTDGTF